LRKPKRPKPSVRVVKALLKVATQQQLTAAGLTDDQKAWELLTPAKAAELNALITLSGKDKTEFLSAFTAGAIKVSNEYGYSWMELNWFDFALGLTVVAVAALLGLLLLSQQSGEQKVVAARDLAAFVAVGPADVKLEPGKAAAGGFKNARDLGSRYPLLDVKKGTALNERDFSSGSWQPQTGDASLLEVPLKGGWDFAGWKMPVKATLVASPRQASAAGSAVTLPVLVVGVKTAKNATNVLVSMTGLDKTKAAAFQAALASSDVYAMVAAPR
jgi:hypothetical protein